MSKLRRLLAVGLAIAALPGHLLAQSSGTITGRVTDQQRQPIGGAQVMLVNGTGRTVTAQDGTYRLAGVRAGSIQVSATRIGFEPRTQTVTVPAGGSATADFTLGSSALEIGGLVVTASGREQRQRELGNAVATIAPRDVELAAVPSASSLLQGRSAGVVVSQGSGTSGTASRIRIRGSNSVSLSNEPLVIIDGVRVNSNDPIPDPQNSNVLANSLWQTPSRIDDINPEDIENIEILKGPAASALYGTAAANGVIQITTKRGRAGKTRWSTFAEYGSVRDVTEYPTSFTVDVDPEYRDRCRVVNQTEGECTIINPRGFNPLETPGYSPFVDGHRSQLGLNVSGGSDAVTFYISGDVEDEQGIYADNTVDRINLRANFTSRFNEQLNVSLKTGYVMADLGLVRNDNDLYGPLLNGLLGTGDSTVTRGYWSTTPEEAFEFKYGQENRRFTGSINADYRPFGWLNVVGTAGLDQVNRHDFRYVDPNKVFVTATSGEGQRASNRSDVLNLTGTLSGTATFSLTSDLLSTTSLGTQYSREDYHDTDASGVGLAPGTRSLGGTSRLFTVDENTLENATLGAFVQQQIAWRDRLYLTAALRGDDNSAFGTAAEWVTYPSLSAAWAVSEEPFFPGIPGVTSFRLRSAYGKSGLRPSFRDAITFYSPVAVRVGNSDVPGVTLGTLDHITGTGNVDLRPEISTELELGFDLGLLNDRVGLQFTYYTKESEDALVRTRVAPSFGLTRDRFENIGRVSNNGVEALLNAKLLDTRPLAWDMTLNASTTRNRLEELGEGVSPINLGSGRTRQRHVEGYPLGGYWMRPITYSDANGDGFLAVDEVQIGDTAEYRGTPFPKREASLNTSFTLFEVVRIGGLLDYKGGHQLLNFTRFDRCSWEALCEAAFVAERSNFVDQAGYIAFNYLTAGENTDVYIEDADFVKLRELSVSVGAPQRWAQRFGAEGARFTVAGRNLKTWTKYSGLDPEINGFGGIANFQTYEYYTQPPVRYVTARLDFTF